MNEEYIYLLKDKIYLYLLAFYNLHIKPTYTQLAEELKITRQTASVKFKNLLDTEIIKIKKENGKQLLFVKNPLNLKENKLQEYFIKNNNDIINFKEFLSQICDESLNLKINTQEMINQLHVSNSTYYENKENIVYGIIYNHELKYIGKTDNYKRRMNQHIKIRPFLTEENFIILSKTENINPNTIERYLIEILNPEWNIVNRTDFN